MKSGILSYRGIVFFGLLFLCFFFCLCIGTCRIPVSVVVRILGTGLFELLFGKTPEWGSGIPAGYESILMLIRLPRVVTAMLVGGALAVSGTVLQSTLKNALVDSYIVGISAGAAFGATLAFAFWPGGVETLAFGFAMAAMGLTYAFAKIKNTVSVISLILAGIVINAFFLALASMVKLLMERERVASVVYWLMGSFSGADWPVVSRIAIPLLGGFILLFFLRWRLNVISMGEDAATLGIHVGRMRLVYILVVSAMTAIAVAYCGIIGWVGLIIPHIARMATGPDHRTLVPFTIIIGACFMGIADVLSRTVAAVEIPIGIVTTLLGIPFFLYLLRKTGGGAWHE